MGVEAAILHTSAGNVSLTGMGANFKISQVSGNFGSLYPGQSSSVTYTITNLGNTALTLVSSIGYPESGYVLPPYSLTSNGCGAVVAIGGSCQMIITFAPGYESLASADWTLTDTTTGVQLVTALNGTALESIPTISPTSITFTNIPVNTTSTQTFTINAFNDDGVSLQSTSGSSPFSFPSGMSCPSTPCTLSVSFTPSAAKEYGQYITITDVVSGWQSGPEVYGNGGAPSLSISPSSLTFSLRTHGSTSIAQTVTITNTGNYQINISSMALTGTSVGDFVLGNNTCGTYIRVGSSCTVGVSYAPVVVGTSSAYLSVVSNSATSPDTIPLSGTAD
jgi:hypothetical protein